MNEKQDTGNIESSLQALRIAVNTLRDFASFLGFGLEDLRMEELFTPLSKEITDGTFRICLSYPDNSDSVIYMKRRIYKTFVIKDNEILGIYDGLVSESNKSDEEK